MPPRFLKPKGRNTLEGQVRAELEVRGLPQPSAVRRLEPSEGELVQKRSAYPSTHTTPGRLDRSEVELVQRSRHFLVRRGRGGTPPPVDFGFMLELEFPEPLEGPLALGYGSHFGLGLFVTEREGAAVT